ncbi:MAG: hypothetical protein ACI9YT_000912 [Halobacteriales archaeon]|jgi:hypothetical protein
MLNPLRWLARLLKRDELSDAEKRALDTVAIYSAGGMSYERLDAEAEDEEAKGAEGPEESADPGATESDRSAREGWKP